MLLVTLLALVAGFTNVSKSKFFSEVEAVVWSSNRRFDGIVIKLKSKFFHEVEVEVVICSSNR